MGYNIHAYRYAELYARAVPVITLVDDVLRFGISRLGNSNNGALSFFKQKRKKKKTTTLHMRKEFF